MIRLATFLVWVLLLVMCLAVVGEGIFAVAMAAPPELAQIAQPTVTPPTLESTLGQLLTYVIVGSGGVAAIWASVKAGLAWIGGQLAAKDAIIAAKDAEIARLNTEADKREDARNALADAKYEALRTECRTEREAAREEVNSIMRDVRDALVRSGSGSLPKPIITGE